MKKSSKTNDAQESPYSLTRVKRVFFRKARSAVMRFGGLLFRIASPRAWGGTMRGLASIPLCHHMVVPLWYGVLAHHSHRLGAVDWLTWAVGRWHRTKYAVLQVEALLYAKEFDRAQTALGVAKTLWLEETKATISYQALSDLETILLIETRAFGGSSAVTLGCRSQIAQYCYTRAWEKHAVMDGRAVGYFVGLYLEASGYEPAITLHVVRTLLTPNAMWALIDEVCEAARANLRPEAEKRVSARRKLLEFDKMLSAQSTFARLEMGLAKHEDLPPPDHGDEDSLLALGVALLSGSAADQERGVECLKGIVNSRQASNSLRAQAAGWLGVHLEEQRRFAEAKQFYITSYIVGGIPFFLPEYLWRYASFCMATGDWAEAVQVMRSGLSNIWTSFRRLARVPIETRMRKKAYLPAKGAFFIGCNGIGDDIVRLGMFRAMWDGTGKIGVSVDPRMKAQFARSLPSIEFVSASRMTGPFAVSETEYWRLRDGIPPGVDNQRIDRDMLALMASYPEVALTEDLLISYLENKAPTAPAVPMLNVLPDKQEWARNWLKTLGPGLTVGVSWRSGSRDIVRDKSYTDIVDWGAVFGVGTVTFINLQYSYEDSELEDVWAKHGCRIHNPPDVDLKNDIEEITALATVLDVVISPGTTVREMCAAAGANVWSLSTTPFYPDLWRIADDGEGDKIFPSMRHFTAEKYGSAEKALDEIARRLRLMTQE